MSRFMMRKNAMAAAILSVGFGLGSAIAQTAGSSTSAATANPSTSATTSQGSATAGKSALDRSERKFIEEAAAHGMAEVELGKLAQEKAGNEQVKKFGERMVQDHGKANDELKQIATSKNVQLPTGMDRKHRKDMEKLQKLSGADFDRAYMQHMVSDHKKDVSDFQKVAKSAKDSELKSFASSTLPTLQEHLKLAQTTHDAVKSDKGAKTASGGTGATSTSGTGTGGTGGTGSTSGSSGTGSSGSDASGKKY